MGRFKYYQLFLNVMRETTVPTEIELEWPSSKEALATLIRNLSDEKRMDTHELRDKGYVGGGYLEGFIYDLGHSGRGLDDFPPILTIKDLEDSEFYETGYPEEQGLKTTINASKLLQQLATPIKEFLQTKPETGYQRYVDSLQTLADCSADDRIRLVLEPGFSGQKNRYMLESFSFLRESRTG